MHKNRFFGLAIAVSFIVALLAFSNEPVKAEPYLAIRTGYKCSQCHVNQTGGGKRTEFGVIYAQTRLYTKQITSKKRSTFFDGKLNDLISVGANFRADDVSIFRFENSQAQADFSNSTRISEANLYLQMDVIPDALSVYIDQTVAPAASNREFFGLIQGLPLASYLKVGQMLLPYGFRLLDDDAFIRNETGYTYNLSGTGVELGLEPGPLSLIANVTDNRLSLVGSTVYRRVRFGGSYGRNLRRTGDYVLGAFAGVNFGRFTLLGEGDFIHRNNVDRFAGIAELNFLIRQGINFKAAYEFFDRNTDVSNERDGQERITLGVEPFVTQFLQLGIFYRINRFVPQNARLNQDQLTLQFHVFF